MILLVLKKNLKEKSKKVDMKNKMLRLVNKKPFLMNNQPNRIFFAILVTIVVAFTECIEGGILSKAHNFALFINAIGECALICADKIFGMRTDDLINDCPSAVFNLILLFS